ncbi:hypothetical protein [Sediminibacter sp. Hel_I_10]|uniref:hypothetical protein n=1 Tax=Sediminibacter sp. Hel_I_10 TaxID=1392490 RepID=UPI0009E0505F|nr:hypothetical protein [Sediminibacter sp. Hel_I_10]
MGNQKSDKTEMYTVQRYSKFEYEVWNNFVSVSKNATFLFQRDFMDYHKDRFEDYSLMIYEGEKLVALLPANRVGDQLYSHQGLTYGGLILKDFDKVNSIASVFNELMLFLRDEYFRILTLKLMPTKYNLFQSNALEYVLFQKKASLVRRDMNFFVHLQRNTKVHKNKKKIYNKEFTRDFIITESKNFELFWTEILKPVLKQKYDVNPVHSVNEIQKLSDRFPDNIQQFNLEYQGNLVAGMTLFIEPNSRVVKSQYGAVNELGKKLKALDFLYLELFKKYQDLGFEFFDLGTTNEADGYIYNHGLTNYKEELGGIPTNLDRYELQL